MKRRRCWCLRGRGLQITPLAASRPNISSIDRMCVIYKGRIGAIGSRIESLIDERFSEPGSFPDLENSDEKLVRHSTTTESREALGENMRVAIRELDIGILVDDVCIHHRSSYFIGAFVSCIGLVEQVIYGRDNTHRPWRLGTKLASTSP